ncbi:hypothetical protein [uncultured Rhodoblastus sp.]|uniref:hypothetical protein n=1 Tax=uncultured Rhodoblastus sp. TaxID=543037 RepID=UPI0025DCA6EB|nr:hypothetical protein [uncultured Rhodoblastus sp.]
MASCVSAFARHLKKIKAWSRNLAHENVLTALASYGAVASHRQAEIMNALAMPDPAAANPFAGLDKAAIRAL